MRKIDIHLHLTAEQLPKNDQMFVSSAQNMLPHLEKLGITKGIVLSSGEGSTPIMTNQECQLIVEKYPECYAWMCNVDEIDPESIYERLAEYKEQGAVGIGELMINRNMNDEFIQHIFAAAEKLELPVLFHMSPEVGFEYGIVDGPGLPQLEENLKRYPNLKFVGHSQPFWHEITGDAKGSREERMQWGKGKVSPGGRLSYLFDTYENLYGDLSANSGGCAIMREEAYGLYFLEKYNTRLMFGTDMVNTDMEFPLGPWLDQMLQAGKLSEKAYENICYHNATKIYKLDKKNEEVRDENKTITKNVK